MRRLIPLAVALLAGAAACTSGPSSAPAPRTTPAPRTAPAEECVISTVHYSHPPAAVPGFMPRAVGLPWTGDDHFVAVLFYARDDSPDIPVGGQWAGGGRNAKILWWAEGATDRLRVHGRESGGARQFTQSFPTVGGGQYPSIVVVPEPGCWTLDATVAGRKVGTITVRAVAR